MLAFSEGLAAAADEMAVTTTMVPRWDCGYNGSNDLVCDDTGDGFADRYGTVYDMPFAYSAPLTRVNDYGEAYVYDTDCSCWAREPSLDELPDY
ncbi:MAG: hypothetical protein KDA53_02355 [Hyphomonas sp.]|nr:hypothetical protein [Hyphomonas sp.]